MGALQDKLYKMKYGTEMKITAALQKPLSLAAKNLQKKLAKEDPEKVKGFLLDLSTSEDMPKEVRDGAKQLLDAVYPDIKDKDTPV
jgi:hypothetical protein